MWYRQQTRTSRGDLLQYLIVFNALLKVLQGGISTADCPHVGFEQLDVALLNEEEKIISGCYN